MNGYPIKISELRIGKKYMPNSITESELTDNALVEKILAGKVKLFRTLVDRYRRGAYLFANGMVGNHEDAYDLSQEAFIRAFNNLNKFNPIFQFKTWFYKILSNLCKNHLRKRNNRGDVITSSELTALAIAPSKARPDIELERTELQKAVWNAVFRLPENFKEIVILNHFQDLSYDEISGVLDIPRGSVMSRLYYARKKLREILEKEGIEL